MRMPAFGLDGPWRDRVGFAPTMEQISGMAWMTGFQDGSPIAPRGACDPMAGHHAVFVLLAALAWRERSGCGQLIELPMIEVALNVTAVQLAEYQRFDFLAERQGNRGPQGSPQNVYACAGKDRWLALAVSNDAQWRSLCRVMDNPEWCHASELDSPKGRRAAADRIDREIDRWLAERDLVDTVNSLLAAGIPAAEVVLPPDVVVTLSCGIGSSSRA